MANRHDRNLAKIDHLSAELEATADKLATCWIYLDNYARGGTFERIEAAALLGRQKAPGWKPTDERTPHDG